MAQMPIELELERDQTTVVGDVDAFIKYLESGQAVRDWYDRIQALTEKCDFFLREHSQEWQHIII